MLLAGALAGAAAATSALLPAVFRLGRARAQEAREAAAMRVDRDASEREHEALKTWMEIESRIATEGILVHRDQRVIYANDAVVRMIGVPRERMVGRSFPEILTGPHGDALLRLVGTRSCYEVEYPDASGALHPYEIIARDVTLDGGPARALVVRDLTETRRAREALRRNEAGFREMIERLPLGVVLHTEGVIRYANAAMLQMTGLETAPEVVGKPVLDFVHPDDRPLVAERMRALADGQEVQTARVRFLAADGSQLHVETTPLRMMEFEGARCNLVVVQDITARLALDTKLQFTDRMVSLGTMAAGVAHEINNPLAYVIGNLELSREGLSGRMGPDELERSRHMLDDALEGADRVRRIVLDLKAFSRADDDAVEPVDVNLVLEAAIRLAGSEIRRRATLRRRLGAVPKIEANEPRLAQVFLNLLVNAAQAIPEGGSGDKFIDVETGTDARGRVVVTVRDTGVGMTPEVRKRIFDPFFTTKPVGEGTGLGLSIVHGLVTAMGGELTVESAPGQGATFRAYLPVREPAASVGMPGPPPSLARARRARILCVDDEPAILDLLERALAGHDLRTVQTGRAALSACLEEDWDLVLCDVMLGDLSGIDLWRAVHEAKPALAARFVFLTGGAFTPGAHEFLTGGRHPHLDKPFRIEAVQRLVAERVPAISAPPAQPAPM